MTRPSIVASLSRNGKIRRASTLARVGLNQPTVTGHITLAALKAVTASLTLHAIRDSASPRPKMYWTLKEICKKETGF